MEIISKRQKNGAAPSTINRNLALLRRMLYLAKEDGKISHVPPIRMLKEPPPRKGFVTDEQFQRLPDALSERLRPLVTFLYLTGCRLSEAMKIKWAR